MPRKRERYINRWRREHPEVRFYSDRGTYEWFDEMAGRERLTVKDFVLKAIREGFKAYDRGFEEGVNTMLDIFIDNPHWFYREVKYRAEVRGLRGFEPALFTVPCSICGKPMVFTHKDDNWGRLGRYCVGPSGAGIMPNAQNS